MLEDAIMLDAFMLALHNCMKKLLDHGNNIIGYQNENNHLKYDLEWFYKDGIKGKRQSMYNPKNELLKVYFPSIQFACLVDEETAQINKTYGTKRIAKMLDYNFFLYKNKGEQKHLSMVSHVSECVSTWKDLIDFEEKDNNNSCALYSVFALYNLNRTSHLFDFWWHQDFDDVPFHLTEGFMTNYVLHKIMQQGREFISEVVNIPDDQYSYGVYYIHDSALEYSLQYTIEDYDWYFLKSLIRRIGATLESYDVRYKYNQAAELVGALKTTGNFISDDFIKWIKSELSNEKEPFKDRIRECINNSRSYYELIYNDIYSNKDEISCLFKHKR